MLAWSEKCSELKHKSACCGNILCRFFIPVFLIGLTFIMNGCDPSIAQFCFGPDRPVTAVANNYVVTNGTCSVCATYDKSSCISEVLKPCFNSYVEFIYGHDNSVCYTQIEDEELSEENALISAQHSFAIGGRFHMLTSKDDNDETCFTDRNNAQLWDAGFGLLLISAVFYAVFGFCVCFVKTKGETNNDSTVLPTVDKVTKAQKYTPLPANEQDYEFELTSFEQSAGEASAQLFGDEKRGKRVPVAVEVMMED